MSITTTIARAGHTVQVITVAVAAGEMMEKKETVTGGPVLTAWVQAASAALVESYKRRDIEVSHVIYISQDPGLHEGDRVRWVQKNLTLAIMGIVNAGGLDRLWELAARTTVK